MKKTKIVLLAVLVALISTLLFLIADYNTRTINYNLVPGFVATDISKQNLIEELSVTPKTMDLALPAISEWEAGDNGAFALGIENNNAEETTFSINTYLSALLGNLAGEDVSDYHETVKSWIVSISSMTLEPEQIDTTDIILEIPPNTQTGIYQFTVAVCIGITECHDADGIYGEASESFYGSDKFAIDLTGYVGQNGVDQIINLYNYIIPILIVLIIIVGIAVVKV